VSGGRGICSGPGRRGAARLGLGGLLLAPQRGRIDDARDDVVECLGHAHGRLSGCLEKETSRAPRERRGF